MSSFFGDSFDDEDRREFEAFLRLFPPKSLFEVRRLPSLDGKNFAGGCGLVTRARANRGGGVGGSFVARHVIHYPCVVNGDEFIMVVAVSRSHCSYTGDGFCPGGSECEDYDHWSYSCDFMPLPSGSNVIKVMSGLGTPMSWFHTVRACSRAFALRVCMQVGWFCLLSVTGYPIFFHPRDGFAARIVDGKPSISSVTPECLTRPKVALFYNDGFRRVSKVLIDLATAGGGNSVGEVFSCLSRSRLRLRHVGPFPMSVVPPSILPILMSDISLLSTLGRCGVSGSGVFPLPRESEAVVHYRVTIVRNALDGSADVCVLAYAGESYDTHPEWYVGTSAGVRDHFGIRLGAAIYGGTVSPRLPMAKRFHYDARPPPS